MNEHIKLFETHSDYEEYINSQDKILPNVSFCKNQEEIHYNEKPHDYSQDYLTFVIKTSGTFDIYPADADNVYYSIDNGETWSAVPSQGGTITVSAGDKLMWKGTLSNSEGKYWDKAEVEPSVHFDAQGNIMSLVYGDNFKGQTDLTGKALGSIFSEFEVENAKNLILPATTLEEGCYYDMFENCRSLTTAPSVLPATTLAEDCYSSMFQGCTSLTTAPELPATTLASNCYYNMFYGCKSLTTAPELPATTLKGNCYAFMFANCTSLTAAPELPATTLATYCYRYMFQDCANLNYIKAMFTTTPSIDYTSNWVNGVSATGTFVKNMSATWNVSGNNGVPSGWTVELNSFGGDDNGEIDSQ